MLSKRINESKQVNQSVNELEDLESSKHSLLTLVKECLLELKKHYGGTYIDERIQNSNLEEILQHFSREQSKLFMFQGERAEESKKAKGQGSQPDLSVTIYTKPYVSNKKPFYIIECKWLKTKRVSNNKEINDFTHSNQYVKGNTGGIERFKKGLYADWLTESLIVGYVLHEDMPYWHEKVNEWIKKEVNNNSDKDKIVWCEWDLLKEDIKEELNPSFISHHIRKSKEKTEWDYICLKHLWIKMD